MTVKEMSDRGIDTKDIVQVAEYFVYIWGGEPEFADIDKDSPDSAWVQYYSVDFEGFERWSDFTLILDKDDNWILQED